jgi:hypothetical protein
MLERARALLAPLVCLAAASCAAKGSYPSAPQHAGHKQARYEGTPSGDAYGGAPATTEIGGYTPEPDSRPGLGTEWGESVWAPVTTTPFSRSSYDPWALAAIYYNDAEGVQAQADYLGGSLVPLEYFAGDGSIGISVVDTAGSLLQGFQAGGKTFVVGADGERYRLVIRNGTSARFEVVASVDGLDVIDGEPADPQRRGYIVDAYGVLVIDGFRQSDNEVAAFRFGAVSDSYAAKTSGDRNVGVIGFAIFAEEGATWTPAELQRRDTADPFPARDYARPPS